MTNQSIAGKGCEMKPVPRDPWALQARAMSALCDDIADPSARNFPRLDALRGTMAVTNTPLSQKGQDRD